MPTPGEVAAARARLAPKTIGYICGPRTEDAIRVLLAALDAAEARATAAEIECSVAKTQASERTIAPDVCPITRRRFFMVIDGLATYGGPHDSYTIPYRDQDGVFVSRHYDHDEGAWSEEDEYPALVLVATENVMAMTVRAETAERERDEARAEIIKLTRERNASIAVSEGLSRTQGCPPMPPGAFVVADGPETRTKIARACFEFDRCDTWIERTNSDTETYMAEADAVFAALREAGK